MKKDGHSSLKGAQGMQNKLRHHPFIEEKDKVEGTILDAQKARKR